MHVPQDCRALSRLADVFKEFSKVSYVIDLLSNDCIFVLSQDCSALSRLADVVWELSKVSYRVATISRLLQIIGLVCKRHL